MTSYLSDFPDVRQLKIEFRNRELPPFREANCHIHTPYSFSSFPDMSTIFRMAKEENISVLGINDFNVTDGYEEFCKESLINSVFPLFNIEFIGLMRKEQRKGIRINDPNNPGRIYFCGKGLDYPFHSGKLQKKQLERVIAESQDQIREMIARLNDLIAPIDPSLSLSYDFIKENYARRLVRERHLAKAVRLMAETNFRKEPLFFIEALYGGKKSTTSFKDTAALENEIRANLLKSGGAAFVEEDEKSFLPMKDIKEIIIKAGGIPCYPVLLDDPSGNYTEFEADPEQLCSSLVAMGIECIELIPGRNDLDILQKFVKYFHEKGFLITFGTEHNTPALTPLTVSARGSRVHGDDLKRIGWEGACVIAAHQYLKAQNHEGYLSSFGIMRTSEKDKFAELGGMVIEYFLNKNNFSDENGNQAPH